MFDLTQYSQCLQPGEMFEGVAFQTADLVVVQGQQSQFSGASQSTGPDMGQLVFRQDSEKCVRLPI